MMYDLLAVAVDTTGWEWWQKLVLGVVLLFAFFYFVGRPAKHKKWF